MTPDEELAEQVLRRALGALQRAAFVISEEEGVCLLCLIYGLATMAEEAEARGIAEHTSDGEHVQVH